MISDELYLLSMSHRMSHTGAFEFIRCSVVSQTGFDFEIWFSTRFVGLSGISIISIELCEFGEFFEEATSGDIDLDESSLPVRTNELNPAETSAAVSRCSVFLVEIAGNEAEMSLNDW